MLSREELHVRAGKLAGMSVLAIELRDKFELMAPVLPVRISVACINVAHSWDRLSKELSAEAIRAAAGEDYDNSI